MNPKFFDNSTEVLISRHDKTENILTAECLEAIAKCIRAISNTDPLIGTIIWSAVKLCRGEASFRIATILDKRARDIRLAASKK